MQKMKSNTLSQDEKHVLINELCKSRHEWHRPPFFRKNDLPWPAAFQGICWHLVRATNWGERGFCRLFSRNAMGSKNLLIKDVDWGLHFEATVRSLSPDVILICRHPCAVVSSRLEGQRLGRMARVERHGWLRDHHDDCLRLGYRASSVLAMAEHELLALEWLIQNLTYHRVLENQARVAIVVYQELCRDPVRIVESLFRFLDWPMGPGTRRFIERSTGMRRSFLGTSRLANHRYFGVFRNQTWNSESWKTKLSDRVKEEIISIASMHPDYQHYWQESPLRSK